jgi:hypothetical protein
VIRPALVAVAVHEPEPAPDSPAEPSGDTNQPVH